MRKQKHLNFGGFQALLRSLGFATYADYLRSPLWRRIRAGFLSWHRYCFLCPCRAVQVHHIVYSRRNLLGQSTRGLRALCRACHLEVEFDGDRKRTLREAQLALKKLAWQRRKAPAPVRSPLDDEFLAHLGRSLDEPLQLLEQRWGQEGPA